MVLTLVEVLYSRVYSDFFFIYLFIFWQIYQRLSEEASNGVEETQDRCIMFLRKFRAYLSKIYSANADDIEKVSPNLEESKNKNYKFVRLMFNL